MLIRETELYHHGVPKMRWGVRRYQNKDGSLTLLGKQRALKMRNKYTEFSKDKKYHDKDGNLTYSGRKKNLKMQEKYSELTGKRLTTFPKKPGESTKPKTATSKPKPKSIKDMTDQELREKVTRLNLENDYKRLNPAPTPKESLGRKMVKSFRDKAADKIVEKGATIAADYFDKKLRDTLGMSKKDSKSKVDQLKELAAMYETREKIDKGQKYFKEGKYKDKKD